MVDFQHNIGILFFLSSSLVRGWERGQGGMLRLEALVLLGVFAPFVAHALPFGAEQDQKDNGANEGD